MPKIWHDQAWEDYIYWQNQDKKTLKKINNLLKDISRNGYQKGRRRPSFLFHYPLQIRQKLIP